MPDCRYVDDEGSIKDLPANLRASDIATCCGKPMQVGLQI
jgi:RNA polymerase II-associated protein 3